MFGNIGKQKRILESTYQDYCNIYNFEKVLNGSITSNERIVAYENIKCSLSQKDLKTTEQSKSENKIDYDSKLFISNDIEIKAGAEIEVNHCGKKYIFNQTGEPFIYCTHQEVLLKYKGKA